MKSINITLNCIESSDFRTGRAIIVFDGDEKNSVMITETKPISHDESLCDIVNILSSQARKMITEKLAREIISME